MKNKTKEILTGIGLVSVLTANSAFAADRLSDEWKEATIATRLALNDVLDDYEINTEVKSEVAHLKGRVSSNVEKELAEEIAKNVDGISSVDNQILVDDEIVISTSADGESVSQKLSDATTTAKVKSRLLWSNGVSGMNVDVKTKRGVVTLSGNVPLASEKELAEKLALKTNGVVKVNNNIVATANPANKVGSVDLKKVEKNAGQALESSGDILTDGWIDTKVNASLRFARTLNVDNLGVKTNGGVVTLTGVAYSNSDKELAAEITKDIKGVKKVINEIKVS